MAKSIAPKPLRGLVAALPMSILAVVPAFAHTGEGLTGGFLGGFSHPLFGPDHVVAMVAVGLWGRSWERRRSGYVEMIR
jgi:urease accessory protein